MRDSVLGERRGSTGARVVVIADNQTMVAIEGGPPVTVWSDPLPLGGADRVSAFFNVHSAFGGSSGFTLALFGEISNDGTYWALSAINISVSSAPLVPIPVFGLVRAAFLRFRFEFTVVGTGVGAACFDLHARLDHA